HGGKGRFPPSLIVRPHELSPKSPYQTKSSKLSVPCSESLLDAIIGDFLQVWRFDSPNRRRLPGAAELSPNRRDYSFSTDTSVALMIAKTASPSLRFIRFTEPVVIIEVTLPAAVRITTSDTTLSEVIFSIVPGKRFRILVLMANATTVRDCSKPWLVEALPVMNP